MSKAVGRAVEAAAAEAERRFGVELPAGAAALLEGFVAELLRWNARINLTSLDATEEVAELHLLDSLAVAPEIPGGSRVLDVGTGGGFPGVPLAIARPDLRVELVDRTEKKVIFLRSTLARLGISNATARHVRLEGHPAKEGIEAVDVAVSRAFAGPLEWIPFARPYVRPGGRTIAMLGGGRPDAEALRRAIGCDRLVRDVAYQLPSGQRRGLLVVERSAGSDPESGR